MIYDHAAHEVPPHDVCDRNYDHGYGGLGHEDLGHEDLENVSHDYDWFGYDCGYYDDHDWNLGPCPKIEQIPHFKNVEITFFNAMYHEPFGAHPFVTVLP